MVKITPFLMFQNQQARDAMEFYISLLPGSAIDQVSYYGAGEQGAEGSVRHARFSLAGQPFQCIDSPVRHAFDFTPSLSLSVNCESEAELDRLYAALVEGGKTLMPPGDYGFSRRYAWLDDRYGVSWQLTLP